MTNRFLLALTVMCLLAEGIVPTWAFPVDATLRAMQPADTSDTLIPVKKGKGHGDREERFGRHYHREAHGSARNRSHSHGVRGYHGNQAFVFGGGNRNQPNGQN
jgi:hypothetical protein